LSQSDTLYGFYLINDVGLTSNWSTRLGFGHAQRPPTLIERYSDGVFLGIIQSGFSRVIGDPNLDKERLWQIDWSVIADYENFRGRGTLYNSWVIDFSTYSGNLISSPTDARLLRSTNTPLATLAGFELYGEGDVSDYVTLFSAMHYVQGTDQSIDAALWGIPPLDARAGLRLHDGDRGRTWGLELGARMVDRQDRIGVIRNAFDPSVLIPIETQTAGFTTIDLRSYYNYTDNISFIGGIENLFDKNYLEHLDLRFPAQPSTIGTLPAIAALSPGFTVFSGVEVNY
jgi:iron complex outermembrane receptor protein